jgi:putative transposase
MPRPPRAAPGGLVYHVLNRGNARRKIFETNADYAAFEKILREIRQRIGMRVLAWCLMPNHWHLVLWPREDGDLSSYMRLVTLTHTQRWHAYRETAGSGHLYQGRFKSFAVQKDAHLLAVCRYVEANPLRAGLVTTAEAWRWSSLWEYCAPGAGTEAWPVDRPSNWLEIVNESSASAETDQLRKCAQRGTPYGAAGWVDETARSLRLESTLRSRGRPGKVTERKRVLTPFL